MLVEVLQNAALLSIAAAGVFWLYKSPGTSTSLFGLLLIGLLYGATTFLVTITPVTLPDGATVDARAGPVILAGMLGGPLPAAIAAVLGGFGRWYVGGNFAFSGVVVYVLYAAVGTLTWHRLYKGPLGDELAPARVALAAALSVGCASLMYFLIEPQERAVAWLAQDLPWIAVANVLSVALTALIAQVAIATGRQSALLTDALQTLELAKKAGGIGVWVYDLKQQRATWDEVNKRLHGITAPGLTGRFEDWERTVHPDDLPRVKLEFQDALNGTGEYNTQYRVVLGDGSTRTLKGDGLVQRDASGAPLRIVGTNFDLTPLVHQEKELQESRAIAAQAQRLDTIGKLTGGVAHDFNNLLAIIQGNLEFLLEDEDQKQLPPEERLDILTSAISATRRGGELTRSMLAFARKSHLAPTAIRINDVVRETENWIARAIPSSIEFDTSLQHNPWPLSLDLASLQSAIVNIIVNARDAMPRGGKLTIETLNVRIDKDYATALDEAVPEGRYVMLAITDTGSGIDPKLLPNVFDPFVTSKELGFGTGLGLSMVQGFARQSGGFVKIYSEPGVGTCVKLYFPVSGKEEITFDPVADPQAAGAAAGAKGRILVAEDQLEVLSVIVRVLKSAGYQVEAATSGDDAYALFRESGPYDLLLTDVVMPGKLRGPELAKACRAQDPDLPVIFMSGYASEATVHGNGLRAEDIRLMKPVPKIELLATVRQCLEDTQPDE
ncbi:ATP-binding protein [Maliponia aquimaris]|uniref:histidine kinase n=1 Tax=Maliponia aquimaris TaxID=1673631 RepID=A0A238KJS9_9RHOB|nr:ATP-binding protein [Maliponia aquimaris]SMX43031.1 Blue-light-activated protein [Maliponia aquimaris]